VAQIVAPNPVSSRRRRKYYGGSGFDAVAVGLKNMQAQGDTIHRLIRVAASTTQKIWIGDKLRLR
jgi:hypothetical protein